MKALHAKVNIIPLLAKADSLTQAEVCKKKMKVQEHQQQQSLEAAVHSEAGYESVHLLREYFK